MRDNRGNGVNKNNKMADLIVKVMNHKELGTANKILNNHKVL